MALVKEMKESHRNVMKLNVTKVESVENTPTRIELGFNLKLITTTLSVHLCRTTQ